VTPNDTSARCKDCPLGDQPVVPEQGRAEANRWIVGQCPGGEEVIAETPFVGPAGRRLDKALNAADVARSGLYVTNAVLCHPPAGKSKPPNEAVKACHDRLIDEIRVNRPRRLLALGVTAARQCTGDRRPIGVLRLLASVPSPYVEDSTVVRVTWHPSPLALNQDPSRSQQFDVDIAWLGGRDLPRGTAPAIKGPN
jgi:uracil-DNA glycosylase family 4